MKIKLFEEYSMEMEDFLTKLVKNNDFQRGDYHQAILNIVFDYWQKNNIWQYVDAISNIDKVCDYNPTLMKFAVLIGKYNQQVGNGGHSQYYHNGYTSGKGGFGDHVGDISLHEDMIQYFEDLELDKKLETGLQIYKIIQAFDIEIDTDKEIECEECQGSGKIDCHDCNGYGKVNCPECDGDGEIDDEECGNCNGDGEIDCDNCNGTGETECDYCDGYGESNNEHYGDIINIDDLSNLDTLWYNISDEYEEEFNNYLKIEFSSIDFQEKVIEKDEKNVIYLYKANILNNILKNKYQDIIDSNELGLL